MNLTLMERIVRSIVRRHGGYREKAVMSDWHTLYATETWNREHQVVHVSSVQKEMDGHTPGFQVDLVTGRIVG